MLQALLKSKLKASFDNPEFNPSEDTLTSSTFGLLQYLPDDVFWSVIRNSCGEGLTNLPESIGVIRSVQFWPHIYTVEGTSNSDYVEPDVLLTTAEYYVIIEAKKYDGSGQYEEQWYNEIRSLNNDDPNKIILFVAMGGNNCLSHNEIDVELNDGSTKTFIINCGSWFTLLNEIGKLKQNDNYGRVVNNIISAMNLHGYFQINWLDSLSATTNISAKSISTINQWNPYWNLKLEGFNKFCKPINTASINKIQEWNPIK